MNFETAGTQIDASSNFILASTNLLQIFCKNHPSSLTVIPTLITEYLCNMVKCCRYCNFPELSVEASRHRCPVCGIQFHGICSDFLHPNAEEMLHTMGNDILCPCTTQTKIKSNYELANPNPFQCFESLQNHRD